MQIVKNAFCAPSECLSRTTTGFGVDSESGLAPNCGIETSSWTARSEANVPPLRKAPQLYGPTPFSGSAGVQFGFVLLNSLGQLWALEKLPPEATVFLRSSP